MSKSVQQLARTPPLIILSLLTHVTVLEIKDFCLYIVQVEAVIKRSSVKSKRDKHVVLMKYKQERNGLYQTGVTCYTDIMEMTVHFF